MTLSYLIDALIDTYKLCGDQEVAIIVDGDIRKDIELYNMDDVLYLEGYYPKNTVSK